MAADIKEAIRRLVFEYTSEGADNVMQTQEAVAASTTKTDKASLSLEKSFGNLERRYVDTVRHQQDYQKVQEKVNAAVAQNPALQERANTVLAAAAQHYDNLALNANKGGVAASFLSKAITTIIGPAGLIGIALTAAGLAITYIVEKFQVIPGVLQLVSAALAAVGFEKAAQNVAEYAARMREGTAAAEAQKAALAQIQAAHPLIGIEVAKQLQLQEAQLRVAQARTPEEKLVADLLLKEVQYNQQGLNAEEKRLLLAGDRKIAEAGVAKQIEAQNDALLNQMAAKANAERDARDAAAVTADIQKKQAEARTKAEREAADAAAEAANMARTQVGTTQTLVVAQQNVTAEIEAQNAALQRWINYVRMGLNEFLEMRYGVQEQFSGTTAYDPLDPQRIIRKTMEDVYGAENIEIVAPTGWDTYETTKLKSDYLNTNSLIKTYIGQEHKMVDSLDNLSKSTDSLNATMQNALSPYYSQDPRTTKLGFRAGTVGNPDWMTGATNANPLDAVLGAGATAPGMASGGSFTVGGGYSANDNKLAVFPVASGEQVIVNRNRGGHGGQVVNIDNRIVVNGSLDADAMSKLKVSRYQQAQRMRAGMARA